jgi:hypothetical protein
VVNESSSKATMVYYSCKKDCSARRRKCKSKKFIVLLLVMMKDIAAEAPLQLLHIQRRDWQSERIMLEKLILQKVL